MQAPNGPWTGPTVADSREIAVGGWRWFAKAPGTRLSIRAFHTSTPGDEGAAGGKEDGSPSAKGNGQVVAGGPRTREEVASLIGHYLRSPLTFILGYASIAAQQPDGPNREMIHSILRHAIRLREVVDDLTPLLEWSLAQAPRFSSPDLCLQTTEVVSSLTLRAEEKGIDLEFDLPSRPLFLAADGWGLSVLLTLLLGHLIKQLPNGAQLCLYAEQKKTKGILTIEGNRGIHWDGQQEGIGLNAIRAMTEVLGGRLEVDSAESDGFRLRLIFPLRGSDTRR